MRKTLLLAAAGAAVLAAVPVLPQQGAPQPGAASPAPAAHSVKGPADLTWVTPPPKLPKGSTMSVLVGDPSQPGPFTLRLKMPAGYTIRPHWHPTTEHITVLSGTFAVGMGETYDEKALHPIPAGGFGVMPADMRHFAKAKTAAVIQVHGTGPFLLNYVNPADDPSAAPAAK